MAPRNMMLDGETLHLDDKLTSANGRFVFQVKSDGNLVLNDNGREIWSRMKDSKRKSGEGPFRLLLQEDGNAVLYNCSNEWLWQTDSVGKGVARYALKVTNEGEVVLHDSRGTVLWSSLWKSRTCEDAKATYTKMYPDVSAFNANSWEHFKVTVLDKPGFAKESREWRGPKCTDCKTSALTYTMHYPDVPVTEAVDSYTRVGRQAQHLWWSHGTAEQCKTTPPPMGMGPAAQCVTPPSLPPQNRPALPPPIPRPPVPVSPKPATTTIQASK
jgi:hypothetical protein